MTFKQKCDNIRLNELQNYIVITTKNRQNYNIHGGGNQLYFAFERPDIDCYEMFKVQLLNG